MVDYIAYGIGSLSGKEDCIIKVDSNGRKLECAGGIITAYTPVLTLVGGSGNTVPEYTTESGRYIQIGKLVIVDIIMDSDGGNEGAGSGQINISLPVTAGSSKINGNMGTIVGQGVGSGNDWILSGIIDQSATTIKLYKFSSITAVSTMTGSDQSTTSRAIRLNFCYETD